MTRRPTAAPATDADAATTDWHVYCLCAAWCGVCTQWRTDFERLAAAHPGLHFTWVDIEDEADTLGDADVETFPTLLVAAGEVPRFFGPVQPQAAPVARLLASLQAHPEGHAPGANARELLQRLQRLS